MVQHPESIACVQAVLAMLVSCYCRHLDAGWLRTLLAGGSAAAAAAGWIERTCNSTTQTAGPLATYYYQALEVSVVAATATVNAPNAPCDESSKQAQQEHIRKASISSGREARGVVKKVCITA